MLERHPEGLLRPAGREAQRTAGGDESFPFVPRFQVNYSLGSIRNQSATATFTRATTATVDDQDSIVRNVLSGEVRFQGLRRVRNHLTIPEVAGTPQNAGTGLVPTVTRGFTDPIGTTTAFRVTTNLNGGVTGTDTSFIDFDFGGPKNFDVPVHSVWLKNNGGSTPVLLRVSSGQAGWVVTIDNTWKRYSITSTAAVGIGGSMFTIGQRGSINPGAALDLLYWHPQLEDAVGQTIQTPAEYVSNAVLSAPYHGANVDGVRYFPWANGNTVSSNVVTETQGAWINPSTRLGYLAEGARTNQILQSEDFTTTWSTLQITKTANAIASPDGAVTADLIKEDNTSNIHFTNQGIAKAASSLAYAGSVWVKAKERTKGEIRITDQAGNGIQLPFDLTAGTISATVAAGAGFTATGSSIKSYPSSWYRLELDVTTNTALAVDFEIFLANAAAATNYLGDNASGFYVWGAQLEQASFASSYMPTTVASFTRNADQLTYPTTGWYNASVGTFFSASFQPTSIDGGVGSLVGVSDGSLNNRISYALLATANPTIYRVVSGGVASVSANGANNRTAGTTYKNAVAYAANDFQAYINGLADLTDTTVTIPASITTLFIGNSEAGAGTTAPGAPISRIAYYSFRMINAQLQALTL